MPETIDHPSIDATIEMVTRLHAGQRDKAGVPYIAHPLAVMRMVPERSWHVAVLHDTLEDCGVTRGRLEAFGYDEEEIVALELLTRRKRSEGRCGNCPHVHVLGDENACTLCDCKAVSDETYDRFIDRIATSGNAMAIEVKIADLTDNLDPNRTAADETAVARKTREKRYRNALYRLMMAEAAPQ